MTKILKDPTPSGRAAAYLIQQIRDSEGRRAEMPEVVDAMVAEKAVPWDFFAVVRAGVSVLMSQVAQKLKDKKVASHSKLEGWFLCDEATAEEIVQGCSTRMRRGFSQTANAIDEIDESTLTGRGDLADDLKALGELIDEYKSHL